MSNLWCFRTCRRRRAPSNPLSSDQNNRGTINDRSSHPRLTLEEVADLEAAAEAMQTQFLSFMANEIRNITTEPVVDSPHETILMDRCRACSDYFEYTYGGRATQTTL